jgi:hypothetical protein
MMVAALVSWPSLFAAVVIVGFAYALFKVNRKTHKLDPLRHEVMQRPILYRRSHPMKYLLNGQWSLKTLAAMELVVTEGGVGITSRIPRASDVLGGQWWARSTAFDARVEIIAGMSLSDGSEWVVIRSKDEDNSFEVAILPEGHLAEIITALREAGSR